jgi:hypothetical protein
MSFDWAGLWSFITSTLGQIYQDDEVESVRHVGCLRDEKWTQKFGQEVQRERTT